MDFDSEQPHRDARSWGKLIAAIDTDAMVALISSWMGPRLRGQLQAEDVWQETLTMAWRDCDNHEWRDLRSYRAWLRGIAKNRLRDLYGMITAKKRGGGTRTDSMSAFVSDGSTSPLFPYASTTPSRVAARKERVMAIADALESLPDEYRELVRMCLFEEMPVREAAESLGLSISTAYRYLLLGTERYRASLRERLSPNDSILQMLPKS